MFYHIQTLEKAASNFLPWSDKIFIKDQVKFILDEPLHRTPLPSKIQAKFNHVVIPQLFENYINDIHNLKVYDDDVWVIGFPRSGSNWLQETVWQICSGVDFDDKGKVPLKYRFPLVEEPALVTEPILEPVKGSKLEFLEKMERPRFIKSHLPIAFLPKEIWEVKAKIVYVARDAKDAAVSWFHFNREAFLYQGTLDEFLNLYLKGHVEYGDYWDHFEQYHLLEKYCGHIKVLQYEEMKKDLKTVLVDLCQFLNKPLTEQKLDMLVHRLSFESMKSNPADNYEDTQKFLKTVRPGHEFRMIRKGQVGSFKEEMPSEMVKIFDEKSNELAKRIREFLHNIDN